MRLFLTLQFLFCPLQLGVAPQASWPNAARATIWPHGFKLLLRIVMDNSAIINPDFVTAVETHVFAAVTRWIHLGSNEQRVRSIHPPNREHVISTRFAVVALSKITFSLLRCRDLFDAVASRSEDAYGIATYHPTIAPHEVKGSRIWGPLDENPCAQFLQTKLFKQSLVVEYMQGAGLLILFADKHDPIASVRRSNDRLLLQALRHEHFGLTRTRWL